MGVVGRCDPCKERDFQLPVSYRNMQSPSVEYRGIFINDEDWGLTPWSWQTYEPSNVKGQIGPKTHERIFELMLRLRANTFWPAMHGCSVPFILHRATKKWLISLVFSLELLIVNR